MADEFKVPTEILGKRKRRKAVLTSRQHERRQWAQASSMTGRDLRDMMDCMGLTNRQLAYETGVSEISVSNYSCGSSRIPLVFERAVCFLALKRLLLVHDIVADSRAVGRLDVGKFLERFRAISRGDAGGVSGRTFN